MIAPKGGYFTYAYDQADRLAWMSNPEGNRTTFSYDVADRETLLQMANGTRASSTYDAADRRMQKYDLTLHWETHIPVINICARLWRDSCADCTGKGL